MNASAPHSPRRVSILGSTGSIGKSTIKLLQASEEKFSIEVLTAHSNVVLLAEQARALNAKRVVIADMAHYAALKTSLKDMDIIISAGADAVCEAASVPADWVMAAIVGVAGLKPTLQAIRQGTVVALANKECLVCAGELMMQEVERCGAKLVPVDSEHSAIAQVLKGNAIDKIRAITLTASGGPFRNWTKEAMAHATPEQALKHPNWSMGAKITIDSATMMNKGLELIEAYHLFPLSLEQIEVLVHPESIIHGMVEYKDGSVLAQMGQPDMVAPIAVALAWPERMDAPVESLNLVKLGKLSFEPVDDARFPALSLVRRVAKQGGGAPILMNAANEVAVAAFLDGEITFGEIVSFVEYVLSEMELDAPKDLNDVLRINDEALYHSRKLMEIYSKKAA